MNQNEHILWSVAPSKNVTEEEPGPGGSAPAEAGM